MANCFNDPFMFVPTLSQDLVAESYDNQLTPAGKLGPQVYLLREIDCLHNKIGTHLNQVAAY